MTPPEPAARTMTSLSLFAVTAPGLEPLAQRELREMGIEGAAETGGVAWEGDAEQMQSANLRLRTASRVLVRIAEFRSRAFYEMERHTGRIEWERYVVSGTAVRVRVSSSKSKLYHEGAIAERILGSIAARVPGVTTGRDRNADEDEETTAADAAEGISERTAVGESTGDREPAGDAASSQLFVVRFHRDRCTISADSSGELLHRRGYRLAVARAPLRETLACAMLEVSGWTAGSPLLDPFCGAGTIPIEAALAARRIPPGLARADRTPRPYAFEAWPDHQPEGWRRIVDRARSEILEGIASPIVGSDRDAGAIEAASANAVRAGVAADVEFSERALSTVEPPPGVGWLVTNPPYGHRVGDRDRLRNLYASLGRLAKDRLPGWMVAYLSADARLDAQTGIELEEALRTKNGGIPVRVVVGRS